MEFIDPVINGCDDVAKKIFEDFAVMDPADPNYKDQAKLAIEAMKIVADTERNNDIFEMAERDRDLKHEQLGVEKSKIEADIRNQDAKIKLDKEKLESDIDNSKYQRGIDDEKNRIDAVKNEVDLEKIKAEEGNKVLDVLCEVIKTSVSLGISVMSILAHKDDLRKMLAFEEFGHITKSSGWKIIEWIKTSKK